MTYKGEFVQLSIDSSTTTDSAALLKALAPWLYLCAISESGFHVKIPVNGEIYGFQKALEALNYVSPGPSVGRVIRVYRWAAGDDAKQILNHINAVNRRASSVYLKRAHQYETWRNVILINLKPYFPWENEAKYFVNVDKFNGPCPIGKLQEAITTTGIPYIIREEGFSSPFKIDTSQPIMITSILLDGKTYTYDMRELAQD